MLRPTGKRAPFVVVAGAALLVVGIGGSVAALSSGDDATAKRSSRCDRLKADGIDRAGEVLAHRKKASSATGAGVTAHVSFANRELLTDALLLLPDGKVRQLTAAFDGFINGSTLYGVWDVAGGAEPASVLGDWRLSLLEDVASYAKDVDPSELPAIDRVGAQIARGEFRLVAMKVDLPASRAQVLANSPKVYDIALDGEALLPLDQSSKAAVKEACNE